MSEQLLRFLDDGTAKDLNITTDTEGDNYLGVNPRFSVTPVYDSAASVAAGGTQDIYQLATAEIRRIRKIVCTGQPSGGTTGHTDAFFKLFLGASANPSAFGKTSPSERMWVEDFAGGVLYVPASTIVRIQVTNCGNVTANFETIFYEGL